MPKISAVRDRLKRLTLATFSQPVFIRGIEYSAIFKDEEFIDDVGVRKTLSLSVDKDLAILLVRGDSVYVDGVNYKIDHIPDINDPIIEMDLKHA